MKAPGEPLPGFSSERYRADSTSLYCRNGPKGRWRRMSSLCEVLAVGVSPTFQKFALKVRFHGLNGPIERLVPAHYFFHTGTELLERLAAFDLFKINDPEMLARFFREALPETVLPIPEISLDPENYDEDYVAHRKMKRMLDPLGVFAQAIARVR